MAMAELHDRQKAGILTPRHGYDLCLSLTEDVREAERTEARIMLQWMEQGRKLDPSTCRVLGEE